MKLLVYGAGVLGSLYSARLHEAGHDVSLNWAAGPEPLGAVIGHERVLLGFPTAAGVMDGDVVRYRATSLTTRLFPMPIGEPDGRSTPRRPGERQCTSPRRAGWREIAERGGGRASARR